MWRPRPVFDELESWTEAKRHHVPAIGDAVEVVAGRVCALATRLTRSGLRRRRVASLRRSESGDIEAIGKTFAQSARQRAARSHVLGAVQIVAVDEAATRFQSSRTR